MGLVWARGFRQPPVRPLDPRTTSDKEYPDTAVAKVPAATFQRKLSKQATEYSVVFSIEGRLMWFAGGRITRPPLARYDLGG